MLATQLELDLKSAIALALEEPEQADIALMCDSLEGMLEGRSHFEQLKVAGEALYGIAEVLHKRAELSWSDWVDLHNEDGPVPDDDFLAGLVQETMFLDISGLVRQPKSRNRMTEPEVDSDSCVEEMDKDQLLALLEAADVELDPEPVAVAQLEHDEDVEAWVRAIALWLEGRSSRVRLVELLEGVDLAIVPAWMGLLLGGFEMRQSGGFYEVGGVEVANQH